MEAIGLVETKGLLSAIQCLDCIMKTADVVLVKKEIVGGGLVTIVIKGVVADVEAAVQGAVSLLTKDNLLVSYHVIPRGSDELTIFFEKEKECPILSKETLNEKELAEKTVTFLRSFLRERNSEQKFVNQKDIKYMNKAKLIEEIMRLENEGVSES